jgi:uncharacterized peroxidase-related enzyme
LRLASRDDGLPQRLRTAEGRSSLSDADHAIADFAVRLTRAPSSIEEQEIARLRGAGLNDVAILHVVEIAAYFNFVNRLADGLGVSLET